MAIIMQMQHISLNEADITKNIAAPITAYLAHSFKPDVANRAKLAEYSRSSRIWPNTANMAEHIANIAA